MGLMYTLSPFLKEEAFTPTHHHGNRQHAYLRRTSWRNEHQR